MAPSFQALSCWKQILSHVGVGMGAASFWRGAWYILDDQLFPDNANWSAAVSLALGTGGMAVSQGIVARAMAVQKPFLKPVARFGALYTVAMSCVLVWRGTWVGWDCLYEHFNNEIIKCSDAGDEGNTVQFSHDSSAHNVMATSSVLEHSPAHTAIKSTDPGHLTYSGLASHGISIVALGACGVFASVLAPPAAVSVIKDLAIKVSRAAPEHHRKGTTTFFKKKIDARDDVNNKAYEFIPHLAGYLQYGTSRVATTGVRFASTKTRAPTTVIAANDVSRFPHEHHPKQR